MTSDNSSRSIYSDKVQLDSRCAEDEVRQPRARALVEPDAREWHDHTESVGEHVAHRTNHRRVLPVDLPRHTRGGWFRCRLSSAEIFFPGCIQPGLDSRLKKSSQDRQGSSQAAEAFMAAAWNRGASRRWCAVHLDLVGPGPGIVEQTRRNEPCPNNANSHRAKFNPAHEDA